MSNHANRRMPKSLIAQAHDRGFVRLDASEGRVGQGGISLGLRLVVYAPPARAEAVRRVLALCEPENWEGRWGVKREHIMEAAAIFDEVSGAGTPEHRRAWPGAYVDDEYRLRHNIIVRRPDGGVEFSPHMLRDMRAFCPEFDTPAHRATHPWKYLTDGQSGTPDVFAHYLGRADVILGEQIGCIIASDLHEWAVEQAASPIAKSTDVEIFPADSTYPRTMTLQRALLMMASQPLDRLLAIATVRHRANFVSTGSDHTETGEEGIIEGYPEQDIPLLFWAHRFFERIRNLAAPATGTEMR